MARYEVRAQPVRYRVDRQLAGACLYRPLLPDPQPAVLVVHDEVGVSNQLLGVAERYAHVGYVTLAVDLYQGEVVNSAADADLRAERLSAPLASRHLRAALRWLRAQPFVKGGIVGAVGFSIGGQLAALLAAGDDHVQAAVAFYAPADVLAQDASSLRAPVLGFYGTADMGIPAQQGTRWQDAPRAVGAPVELVVYPDAAHAFFDERQSTFNFAAAEDAWSRSNKFFYRYLGEPK